MAKQKQGGSGKKKKKEAPPPSRKKKGGPQRAAGHQRGAATRRCERCGGNDTHANHRVKDADTGFWCYISTRCAPENCPHCEQLILVGHVREMHGSCGLLSRPVHTVSEPVATLPTQPKRITDASGRKVPRAGETCPHCECTVEEGSITQHFSVKTSPRTGRQSVRWRCPNVAEERRQAEATQQAAAARQRIQTTYVGRWENHHSWICTNPDCSAGRFYSEDQRCPRCRCSRPSINDRPPTPQHSHYY